jgi:hypothetical protein
VRRPSALAIALFCAIAGCGVFSAPAVAASPLAWSSPTLVDNQGPFGLTNEVRAVSCVDEATCVAVGDGGKVVTSTDPADGATASWKVAGVDAANSVRGVSCLSSPSLCVAVDDVGNAIVSTDPTGGASKWSAFKIDSAFNSASMRNDSLSAVSCASSPAVLCVAVDDNGNVVTSTDPVAGPSAWTLSTVDTASQVNQLTAVSCPSSGLCVATDAAGNVLTSTDPAGGVAAWSTDNVDGTNAIKSVSCPSTALCVAVDGAGQTLTASDPAGGSAAWTAANIDAGKLLEAVSCASASLCIAVDVKGNALTTLDPTDGATATWGSKLIDKPSLIGFPFPVAVDCVSAALCVVADNAGRAGTTL